MCRPDSRHPSQIYEAFLEGLCIFVILYYCISKAKFLNKPGRIAGIFCILYGMARIFVEFFREPDRHIGAIYYNYTMGMILSIPLIILGIYLYSRTIKILNKE